jgi:hypothetical protein
MANAHSTGEEHSGADRPYGGRDARVRSDRMAGELGAARGIAPGVTWEDFAPGRIRPMRLFVLCAVAVLSSSCAPTRVVGPGRAITDCNYCVVTEKHAHRFADPATEILDKAFVVVKDDDVRLQNPAVKQNACLLQIEWSRGFWKSSAILEIIGYS